MTLHFPLLIRSICEPYCRRSNAGTDAAQKLNGFKVGCRHWDCGEAGVARTCPQVPSIPPTSASPCLLERVHRKFRERYILSAPGKIRLVVDEAHPCSDTQSAYDAVALLTGAPQPICRHPAPFWNKPKIYLENLWVSSILDGVLLELVTPGLRDLDKMTKPRLVLNPVHCHSTPCVAT